MYLGWVLKVEKVVTWKTSRRSIVQAGRIRRWGTEAGNGRKCSGWLKKNGVGSDERWGEQGSQQRASCGQLPEKRYWLLYYSFMFGVALMHEPGKVVYSLGYWVYVQQFSDHSLTQRILIHVFRTSDSSWEVSSSVQDFPGPRIWGLFRGPANIILLDLWDFPKFRLNIP